MSNYVNRNSLREVTFGAIVRKAAQVPPNSGSSATIFTVAGGVVLVTSLVGRVSTVLSGSTGAIALGTKPTAGTEETAGIATATVVGGAEAGTLITVGASTGLATALVVSAKLAGNVPYVANCGFLVNAGIIEVTTSTATMTGAIDWYLTYVPLDAAASVS